MQELSPEDSPPPAPGLYRVAWIFYLVLAAGAVVWIGWREGGFGPGLFVAGDEVVSWRGLLSSWRELAVDAALGVGVALLVVGGWELAERTYDSAAALSRQLRELLGDLSRSEAVSLAILSGIAEELFFRGALQGALHGWSGWLLATTVFALVHGGPGRHFRWWTAFAAAAGGGMGLLVLLRGTLTAAVVCHVTVNGIQLLRSAAAAEAERGGAEAGSGDAGDTAGEDRGDDDPGLP